MTIKLPLNQASVFGKSSTHMKPLRIHQSIAREIGVAILAGEIAPGENLGGEVERAQERGVSRTTYREAIRILIAKGMVVSRPKAGTHVTSRDQWNLLDPDILEWSFSECPDEVFIHELFELRYIIEPAAAFLAAERRTEEQVEEMRDAMRLMRLSGLTNEQGREADTRFHDLIMLAAGNSALATLTTSIGAAVSWTTRYKQQNNKHPRDSYADHEKVFKAIEDRDAMVALEHMRMLLKNAREDMNIPQPPQATRLEWATP